MKNFTKKLSKILSFLIALICLVSCNTSKKLEYYNPLPYFEELNSESELDEYADISFEANEEQKELVLQVFQELSKTYALSIESPNIKTLSTKSLQKITGSNSLVVSGMYDGKNTIYLGEKFSEKEISIICHELCHYISGDGLKYVIDGKYVTGNSLNEGFTNYFSTKVYPHNDNKCIYEFETFIASQLVTILGEEQAKEIFFHGGVNNLRDDFNISLEEIYPNEKLTEGLSTPFDTMCSTLNFYNIFLANINENPEMIQNAMTAAECVEEMILKYAEQKEKKQECQEMLKEFLMNEQQIRWTFFSNLDKMT